MPTLWFSSLRKSLHCKTNPSDVHDPYKSTKKQPSSSKSGCSRTLSNLRDVIHGSKRHIIDNPVISSACSPRSIQSSEFFNPIAHDVILTGSGCDLKISGYPVLTDKSLDVKRRIPFDDPADFDAKLNRRRRPAEVKFDENGGCTCHKCGEKFTKSEALEAHHLSKHAITELVVGDSSRKIVEIICRPTSCLKAEQSCVKIQRIYKIHNMSKTLAQFEEYREVIKAKASKLAKKHPRCVADGNELLRFHGTSVACSLGQNGDTTLCTSLNCSVCKIIRHGFSIFKKGGIGVFTASTSGRAIESIEMSKEEKELPVREALVICRVIAGRVHKPLENVQDIAGQSGFDSLAGKIGIGNSSNIEDLYLLNPKALLPCFVVICKT